ncbi:MAG TPA: hypothetical protein VES95_13520 [Dermatophilaceae bacterium]|nr:hypothetical protein [Dermatophilaceae bacterium]
MSPDEALLAATALHLGFQAVVTAVVYPSLLEVPTERWAAVHAAHSRRITYVVGPVYLLLAAACLWVLAAGPRTALTMCAVTASAVVALLTASVAAPTHGRLGRDGPSRELVARLRVCDHLRLGAALLAAGAALAAVLSG